MMTEFLGWWTLQLRSLAPGIFRDGGRGGWRRRALVVSVADLASGEEPGAVEVFAPGRGRDNRLGCFSLDAAGIATLLTAAARHARHPTLLRLPPALVLEQEVSLPLGAERNLERVLQYEMDRLTPFAADELFWSWTVVQRDRAQVHLLLSLVPRASLAPLLDALQQARIRPVLIESGAAVDGLPREILLERPHSRTWQRRGVTVMAALCAVLAAAVVAAPFVLQHIELGRIDGRIAALKPKVDRAEALRRAIARNAAGTDVIEAQRAKVGEVLQVIATLTDVLPDDTYLVDLAVRARTVTLSGQSAAAARLIAAFSANGAIRNPAFAAPVTRNEGNGGEGFSIRAEMAP